MKLASLDARNDTADATSSHLPILHPAHRIGFSSPLALASQLFDPFRVTTCANIVTDML